MSEKCCFLLILSCIYAKMLVFRCFCEIWDSATFSMEHRDLAGDSLLARLYSSRPIQNPIGLYTVGCVFSCLNLSHICPTNRQAEAIGQAPPLHFRTCCFYN